MDRAGLASEADGVKRAQLWWAVSLLASVPALALGLIVLTVHDEYRGSTRVTSRVSDGRYEARIVEHKYIGASQWNLVLALRGARGTREVQAGCVASGSGVNPAVTSIEPGSALVTGLNGKAVEVRFDPATLDVTQALAPELCGD
jgi:hypothetical protein